MKKIQKIFLPLIVACLTFGTVGAFSQIVNASETESTMGQTISVYDKFIGKNHKDAETGKLVWDEYATPISESHVFDYYNVANDKESGYGLVAGETWSDPINAGDGYLIYKIEADDGYLLEGLNFNFTANHGTQGLPEYYGNSKTNIRVSVSDDNVNYDKVYDLGLQRGFPTTGTMKVHEDMHKDISEYAEGKEFVYLRFDILQLTFAEVAEKHQAVIGDVSKQKIYLNKLGVYLHEVRITATQQINETKEIKTETYDYGTKGSVKSAYNIVEYANLAKDVAGNADWGLVPASAWGGTVTANDAYLVYKLPVYTQYDTQNLYMDITYCLRELHNANFLVSVSKDGVTYEPFYDFKQEHLNVYCSGYSQKKTKTLCLNEYFAEYSFVKVEIQHDETSVFLQNLGALLNKISFRSYVNEKPTAVGVLSEDYSVYAINDSAFAEKAFQTAGMQIKQTENGNALANFINQEGYVVYKLQAKEGEPFSCVNVSLQVNFVNSAGLSGESVKLYLSRDGEEYSTFATVQPVDGEQEGSFQISLDKEISGANFFYIKMKIGCPNTTSATSVRSLVVKQTLPEQKYAVSYVLNGGESVGENPSEYSQTDGLTLQKGYREGYYFVGWYADEACMQRVDRIQAGTQGDITLYAKWAQAENAGYSVTTQSSGCNGSISWTVGVLLIVGAGVLFVKKKRI